MVSISYLHKAGVKFFVVKDGNEVKSVLEKLDDVNLFIKIISELRNYSNPEINLSTDGDLEKCIVTCIVKVESYKKEDEDNVLDNYKPTGKTRVLTLAKVDGIPEKRKKFLK